MLPEIGSPGVLINFIPDMLKSFIVVCLYFILSVTALSLTAQVNYTNSNIGRNITFTEQDGSVSKKNDSGPQADGSPMLSKEYLLAEILFINGQEMKNLKVNMNLEANELYYKDSLNHIYVFNSGIVKKVSFRELLSLDSTPMTFKTGYPETGKQGRYYYYQSIEDGHIELLKNYSKYIREIKNEYSGEINREYTDAGVYYVYVFGLLKELRYNKSFFIEIMNDKKAEIEKFINDNKINFKKLPEIQKLIRYYNTLKE
jgi:hypothetical protein